MKRVLLTLCALLVMGVSAGCLLCPAPARDFRDTDLLIGPESMPPHWAVLEVRTIEGKEGSQSGADITFSKTDTPFVVQGGETVYRYSNTCQASWHYRRLEKYDFSPTARSTASFVPDGFDFHSTLADQWRFGCTRSTFSPIPAFGKYRISCFYLARYKEFLVRAGMTIQVEDQPTATMADMQRFLQAIDQKMKTYLEPDKVP